MTLCGFPVGALALFVAVVCSVGFVAIGWKLRGWLVDDKLVHVESLFAFLRALDEGRVRAMIAEWMAEDVPVSSVHRVDRVRLETRGVA